MPRKSTREEPMDRRIQRTRALLHEALGSLIREKAYDRITVADILGRAKVSRSTFYIHFRDKDQLLMSSMRAVLLGVPLGAYLIRYMQSETFRRICMSFDVWIVGFGLARTIVELRMLRPPAAYGLWAAVIFFDFLLLYGYFVMGRFRKPAADAVAPETAELPARRAASL